MTSLSTSLQQGSGLSGKWMGGNVFLRCAIVSMDDYCTKCFNDTGKKNSPLKHYFCFYCFGVDHLKGTYTEVLNCVFLQLETELFLDVLGHKINTMNL